MVDSVDNLDLAKLNSRSDGWEEVVRFSSSTPTISAATEFLVSEGGATRGKRLDSPDPVRTDSISSRPAMVVAVAVSSPIVAAGLFIFSSNSGVWISSSSPASVGARDVVA